VWSTGPQRAGVAQTRKAHQSCTSAFAMSSPSARSPPACSPEAHLSPTPPPRPPPQEIRGRARRQAPPPRRHLRRARTAATRDRTPDRVPARARARGRGRPRIARTWAAARAHRAARLRPDRVPRPGRVRAARRRARSARLSGHPHPSQRNRRCGPGRHSACTVPSRSRRNGTPKRTRPSLPGPRGRTPRARPAHRRCAPPLRRAPAGGGGSPATRSRRARDTRRPSH
jgi:hypothetical protein